MGLPSGDREQYEVSRRYAHLCTKWTVLASLQSYHSGAIYDVAWSRRLGVFATVGGDNSLHIFGDIHDKSNIDQIKSNKGTQENGNVSSSLHETTPCYRQLLLEASAHEQDLNSVHWNDGRPVEVVRSAKAANNATIVVKHQLATGSDDGLVKIWNFERTKPVELVS